MKPQEVTWSKLSLGDNVDNPQFWARYQSCASVNPIRYSSTSIANEKHGSEI